LMAGCNDIHFLEEWANGTKHIPKSHSAQVLASGRNALQLRLMYSFLHESLRVVSELTKRSEFEKLRPLLGHDGEHALTQLMSIKLSRLDPTNKDWGINESILRARHTATVHYDIEKSEGSSQSLVGRSWSQGRSLYCGARKKPTVWKMALLLYC